MKIKLKRKNQQKKSISLKPKSHNIIKHKILNSLFLIILTIKNLLGLVKAVKNHLNLKNQGNQENQSRILNR